MRYRDRFYLVFDDLETVPPGEVADAAARLGLSFPDGYAEYVTELGEGLLSDYLRIWPPKQVEAQLDEHRQRLSENFFWDEDGPLTPARARETVTLGSTMDGDDLVFHPDRPDELFVLPRHDDKVYRVGLGLDAAIDWLLDSGVLSRRSSSRYFEPPGKRESIVRSIPLPYQVVRDALMDLGIHDHVAFEERSEDEEKVFEVKIKVGKEYVDVDDEEAMIVLLVKEFGGDVTIETGGFSEPDSSRVTITHVPNPPEPKLDLYLKRLDVLKSRRPTGLLQKLLDRLKRRGESQ